MRFASTMPWLWPISAWLPGIIMQDIRPYKAQKWRQSLMGSLHLLAFGSALQVPINGWISLKVGESWHNHAFCQDIGHNHGICVVTQGDFSLFFKVSGLKAPCLRQSTPPLRPYPRPSSVCLIDQSATQKGISYILIDRSTMHGYLAWLCTFCVVFAFIYTTNTTTT